MHIHVQSLQINIVSGKWNQYTKNPYCGNLIEQKPIKSSKSLLFLCEIVHISFTHTYFCESIAGVKLLVEYLRLWEPGLRQGIFIVPRKIIYQILYYSFAISNAGLKPLINPTFVSDPFIYRRGSFAWLWTANGFVDII